jgi:hypothetical protein
MELLALGLVTAAIGVSGWSVWQMAHLGQPKARLHVDEVWGQKRESWGGEPPRYRITAPASQQKQWKPLERRAR